MKKSKNSSFNRAKTTDLKYYLQGWVCPKCGAVMGPQVTICVNCKGQVNPIDPLSPYRPNQPYPYYPPFYPTDPYTPPNQPYITWSIPMSI